MAIYNTVLIAVDLTEHSARVIERAVQLFGRSDAALHLVHVVEPVLGDYSFELALPDYDDFQHAHSDAVVRALASLIADIELGIPAERIHRLSGRPAPEIHRLAEEIGADLLVIGSHGHGAMMSLLGSTTNAVLHRLKCDALTVHI